jgi:hypothetical protein
MKKICFSLSLLALAYGAKAQLSNEYVGKTSIEKLKVSFTYTRFSSTDETVIIKDTTYSIDWCKKDITINGDIEPIIDAETLTDLKRTRIVFAGKTLILKYSTDWRRLIGYEWQ